MRRVLPIAWRGPLTLVGGGLTLLAIVLAVTGRALAPHDPFAVSTLQFQPPGASHWLGTDDLGRDTLSGVLTGARVSLLVGFVTAATAALIGATVGGIAGFYGGLVDDLLMRLTELVQIAPRFFLAVLVAALFGPSIAILTILLAVTFWPLTARLVRSQVLSLRQREYVVAARAIGLTESRILLRHVLPNVVGMILVTAALQVGSAIIVEASLGFLGLGDRSVISWGYMLNDAQPFLRVAWWMSVFPGLALVLPVLGVNLFADALYAAWDPGRRSRLAA
ncbi:MAG: ABC transporter permease [Candidatus Limnocylindrales bacterium]